MPEFGASIATADGIPLRRIESSRYTPSEYSQATTTSTTATLVPSSSFECTSSLQIQSSGKGMLSLPLPSSELTIPVFSRTTSRPVYLSIRPSRRYGSCYLVDAEDEAETPIANTKYWFGPGRSPRITIGKDDDPDADVFEMTSKSYITRTVCFESARWGKFEWRYCGRKERRQTGEDINNLLVLEKVMRVSGQGDETRRVAQLVRGEATRTPGTRSTHAGNGGRLEMRLVDELGDTLIDQATVVVTCLVMLKKEIDRLRATQAMMMSGGGGGP